MRVDVGSDVSRELLGADALAARLAQLLERRDREQPHREVRLEAGQDPPGQGVPVDRGEKREDQRLAPLAQVIAADDAQQAFLDHGRGILVHRGQEQGLLVGEVGVGSGAAEAAVPGDVRHRGSPVAVTAEPGDGGMEDHFPGALALGRAGPGAAVGHGSKIVVSEELCQTLKDSRMAAVAAHESREEMP